ncbi:HipA N-terminal domain-containing protein [Planctomycetota bacterium]
MSRCGVVYFGTCRAGLIEELEAGGYRFTYDADYLNDGKAVSLSLPLQAKPFESSGLFPFFAGLIPEGWYLEIVTRTIKVDANDTFGLLLATCGDCIGAVSIREVTDA